MKTETETAPLPVRLSAMGFTIESSPPSPGVEKDNGKSWPHVAYTVTLKMNGKLIWAGPYKLGVGHVAIPAKTLTAWTPAMLRLGLTENEKQALTTLQNKPHATLANPFLHASLAAKLAKVQDATPKLEDVLYSILIDGAAYFDGYTFADWAKSYGYDTDNLEAESVFQTCDAIGRELVRNLGRDMVEELRGIFADY